MDGQYDEDIRENRFFQELKKHEALIHRAITDGWIICVPRRGSFAQDTFDEETLNAHILIPNEDRSSICYSNLNNTKVDLKNKILSVRDGVEEIFSSYLLFEETFYDEGHCKYRIWCIDRPLIAGSALDRGLSRITTISNLQEAATFLWTEVSDTKLLKTLTTLIETFEYSHGDLDEKSIEVQADLVANLYTTCFNSLLKDSNLKSLCSSNEHLYKTLRLSLETYLLYALRGTLRRSVSAVTASTDAALNKILRNSNDLELASLSVRVDLCDRVHTAKLKLSRLDRFATVLGKTECLKRTVRCLSDGLPSISSDDLLPVLVYLVVKSGLSNWIAQLMFMKYFRFSTSSAYEADESSFLITSLEAAIEHLRTSASAYVTFDSIDDEFELCSSSKGLNGQQEKERASLNRLFACIETGDLLEARKILSERSNDGNSPEKLSLCHPLCTCDSCEGNRTHRDLSNWVLVRSKDDKGFTALHLAASCGRKGIVNLLLTRDADVNMMDNDGRTPLHHAAAKGYRDVVSLLLCGNADPTIGDLEKDTPLHLATENGHAECVEVILRLSAEMNSGWMDPNPVNLKGDTPLHRASKWGYEEIVLLLLEYGATPTLRNKNGQTALTIAHCQRISELLSSSVARHSSPCLPAFDASPRSSPSCRSSPEKRNSALDQSAENSVTSTSERTVDKLFAAINQGDTCLACFYLGLENQRKETDRRTEDMCHPLCNCERCATNDEFPEIRRSSGIRVPAVNARNRAGETALHLASAVGLTDLVRILLDAGANVNALTEVERRTPLHLACLCDHADVLKLLLNCATAELNSKDRYGDTPLHLAVKNGNAQLVRLLVRQGANTEIRNCQGITPFQQLQEEIQKDSMSSLHLVTISNILKRNSVENTSY